MFYMHGALVVRHGSLSCSGGCCCWSLRLRDEGHFGFFVIFQAILGTAGCFLANVWPFIVIVWFF